MNKPKKPAVVAKTAPKKRGRPAGVKNKPKTKIIMSLDEKPFAVNWEKLAKQLQVALASEIKDNDQMFEDNKRLAEELSRKRTFWERLVCLTTGAV
jgi:hypothetical protein